MEPSQPIEEEPHEEQHHIGRRGNVTKKPPSFNFVLSLNGEVYNDT